MDMNGRNDDNNVVFEGDEIEAESVTLEDSSAAVELDIDAGGYARPQCAGQIDGEPCPYEPIHKCKGCGELVCIKHAEEFTANNPEERFHQYDGYYCPDCIPKLIEVYNQEVEDHNREVRGEHRTQQACDLASCLSESACACLEDICST